MPDAWKSHERAIAKRLNGHRAGPTGKIGSDVLHPLWAIECKERKELPQWLLAAMSQSVSAARVEQVPIVVLHQLGQRHDNDLVCIRLRDFEDWAGAIPTGKEAAQCSNTSSEA